MPYELFETCMLVPNVSKANCAGWVQAWGSIGAILGVGITLWLQERAAKRLAESEKKAGRRQQQELRLRYLRVAYDLVGRAGGTMLALKNIGEGEGPESINVRRASSTCKTLHSALNALEVEQFETFESLGAVMSGTAALGTVIAVLEQTFRFDKTRTEQWFIEFRHAEVLLKDELETLFKEISVLEAELQK